MSTGAADQPTAITRMNDQFRHNYTIARKEVRDAALPVIVANGDKVMLFRRASATGPVTGSDRVTVGRDVTGSYSVAVSKDERTFVPAVWSVLKSVDHVPLALFVMLQSQTDKPLPESSLAELKALRQSTLEAMPEIIAALHAETLLPPQALVRNQQMLDDSLGFVAAVIKAGSVSRADLLAFATRMTKPSMLNADDAEALDLALLDTAVQEWHTQLTPAEWANLRIVLMGGHMPREQDRRMQYFSLLLNEKREGQRIVYVEGLDDMDKALDLLATHILDERIAQAYFGDPWRMHRDLLSDSAHRYLVKHPPQKNVRR